MRLGILITTYNRPEYLRQCLESVRRSDIPEGSTIMIVDDASTDPETRRLIDSFDYPGVNLHKSYKSKNLSIKDSLLQGFNFLFSVYNCDIVCNLDGDAIVRKDFLGILLSLHERFPANLLTGFNCRTKNKNGSERHEVFNEGEGWNAKYSVGGINMFITKENYGRFVEPALVKSLAQNLNWDHQTCILSGERGLGIICTVPSVVQHIGVESSMGHSAGGEPPDRADDFPEEYERYISSIAFLREKPKGHFINLKTIYNEVCDNTDISEIDQTEVNVSFEIRNLLKMELPDVTLIAVDDNVEGIIKAANLSCEHIEFGAVKLLSSQESLDLRVVPIMHLGSKEAYSHFLLKKIANYIGTPYFITIQADGWIIDGSKWDNSWREWDYIGAPWYFHKDHMKVGNGAMSFRSKRLHDILKNDPFIVPTNDKWINQCQEDHNIARIYRPYLEEKYGIKFAPVEVAEKFSIEAWGRPDKNYNGQFGFHGGNIIFPDSVINKPY